MGDEEQKKLGLRELFGSFGPKKKPGTDEQKNQQVLDLPTVLGERAGQKFEATAAQLREMTSPENLAKARQAIEAAKARGQKIAADAPVMADRALTWSRESRLNAEREGGPHNDVQAFFDKGPLGWLTKTAIQAIPSPIGYGPGDIITGLSAILGQDIMTGRRLDLVDRISYAVATAIPGVPGTLIADPIRKVRVALEEANHSHKTGNSDEAKAHLRDALDGVRDLTKEVKK